MGWAAEQRTLLGNRRYLNFQPIMGISTNYGDGLIPMD